MSTVPTVTEHETAEGWRVRITSDRRAPISCAATDAEHARRFAAELRGAIADAYHAGRADGLALPHLAAHEIDDAPES